jgi:hypothetical protein
MGVSLSKRSRYTQACIANDKFDDIGLALGCKLYGTSNRAARVIQNVVGYFIHSPFKRR